MPIYKFNAIVTVSAYTEVEADSEAEARKLLEEREIAGMAYNSLYPGPDEAWHIDTDGAPENIELVEED